MLRFISSRFILTRVSLFFSFRFLSSRGNLCVQHPRAGGSVRGGGAERDVRRGPAEGPRPGGLRAAEGVHLHHPGSRLRLRPRWHRGQKVTQVSENQRRLTGWTSAREVLPHNIKQSGVFAAIQGPDSLVLRRVKLKIKLTSFFIIDIEKKLKINYVPCWVSFFFYIIHTLFR